MLWQEIENLFRKVFPKNYLTVDINYTIADPERCLPCSGKAKVIPQQFLLPLIQFFIASFIILKHILLFLDVNLESFF